jgi:hypothetical protein
LNAWLEPLKRQLENESAVKAIGQLEELLGELEEGSSARETVVREVAYLRDHQGRMDYRDAQRRKEPLGSGAVEATCAQYPCRLSAPGSPGVRLGTKRYCVWTPSGATSVGICASRTLALPTCPKTEMRRIRPGRPLFT